MTVHTPTTPAEALRELKESLGDRILLDEEVRTLYRSDFGRMVDHCRRRWRAAPPPRRWPRWSASAVSGRSHLPRGQAHTQTGQATSDGGVLLDTA